MMIKELQITPQTLVADLLNTYPQLEDKLIEIAPVFKKLKNPVLRRTIAKVTSLKQAAVVGNVQLTVLINELRKTIGAGEFKEEKTEVKTSKPVWADEEKVASVYDARMDLEKGVHPLAKVMKDISELKDGEVYLLITPFVPAPLIDIVREKGFMVYSGNLPDGGTGTFIQK